MVLFKSTLQIKKKVSAFLLKKFPSKNRLLKRKEFDPLKVLGE